MAGDWSFRASRPADATWMAELRAEVMRPDLERLGRFDSVRVRQRFLDAWNADNTRVIVVGDAPVGLVALRKESHDQWLEHFYLAPAFQGRGIGWQVLTSVLATAEKSAPIRLNVLRGSPAQRLYERAGFTVESSDDVDVFMIRPASFAASTVEAKKPA